MVEQISYERIVTMSELAARKIREFMNKERNRNLGLRVRAEKDTCGCVSFALELDEKPSSRDVVSEEKDLRIFVDPETAKALGTANIDYVSTSRGEGFRITSRSACGPECGCT